MFDRPRPGSLRTAVVWEVLKEALERQAAMGGGPAESDEAVLHVLDTGGGTGTFAVPVARLGHCVTVAEPSPDALAALDRRAAEAGVTDLVHGVQADTGGLLDVAEPESADVVLCHGVLEYVDDPAAALANIATVLRRGGTASLLTANRHGTVLARAVAGHFAEARGALTDPDGRWGDADPLPRRFTVEGLSRLVSSAGLRVGAVHGIRIFSDLVPGSLADTDPGAAEELLRLERAAAEQPAFHAIATQLHLLVHRD
ncbi:methyltransferase domain-containing protein [Allostreptomyces psammosilenae]|uniref:SAM-dependent methyltransferase n=1 Tax=Allostreptomyces psammosilenae TaxID=1892865 RepID=A0A852ZXL6_9ACTN|nr:methyltransferase domain-containing protein [Allostreptomyces psammosilenae]NYI07086.1 SAM-dependent methyltransferase [Allostreptomyces psammosilenae]